MKPTATEVHVNFYQKLRHLCGYVENGTSTVLTIFQDDATRSWVVKVGKKEYIESSLEVAIAIAYSEQPKDE